MSIPTSQLPGIVWSVKPAPRGRYRSFEKRGWPGATYKDFACSSCAEVVCHSEYKPADAKSGHHSALTLLIAQYQDNGSWEWKSIPKNFANMAEVKAFLTQHLRDNPHVMPMHLRPGKTVQPVAALKGPEAPRLSRLNAHAMPRLNVRVGQEMLRVTPPEEGRHGYSQPGTVVEVNDDQIVLAVQVDIVRRMRFRRTDGFDTEGLGSFIVHPG
jgi:hypothetical protein